MTSCTPVRVGFRFILCLLGITVIWWNMDITAVSHLYSSTCHDLDEKVEKEKRVFPDLIGIGIRKCGTGVYMRFLNKHGSFRIPTWSNYETEYFSRRRSFGLRWYQTLFQPTPEDKLAIEKTPHYFYSAPKSIPQDMLEVNPAIKIVLVLCDPTPRAYSCFVHHHHDIWTIGGVRSFEKFVKTNLPKLQRKLSRLNSSEVENFLLKVWQSENECLIAGLYSEHIERWRRHFNESQMLIIDGEAMMKNPGPEYLKLQEFFGVSQKFRLKDWVQHNTTGHFCLRSPQDRSKLICQDNGNAKARTRSTRAKKPNNETIQTLKAFYKPYNEKLYKVLGKRFDWK